MWLAGSRYGLFSFLNVFSFCAPTLYWFMVAMKKEKEMAVAAMAWVEGIPYSAFVLISSFTTGGDRGRGHFRMSLKTWPMYITIWGQERHRAVSTGTPHAAHPRTTRISALFPAESTPPSGDLSPELLKGFPLAQPAKEVVVLLHCVVT